MTLGQEIVSEWRPSWHTDPRAALAGIIDAAIAESRQDGRMEMRSEAAKLAQDAINRITPSPNFDPLEKAEAYRITVTELLDLKVCIQRLSDVAAPAAPVWEHKPGCPLPYQWHQCVWCCPELPGKPELKKLAQHCDGCGTAKPQHPATK